jgi:hypothetical protein
VTAREIGRVTIAEALELTLLIAQKEPHRHSRVGARWRLRCLEEDPTATRTKQQASAASASGA